jgi:hypothetical protein
MQYSCATPFSELSETLQHVAGKLYDVEPDVWNKANDKEKERIVREAVGDFLGKLDEDELEYLTDCNMHTARRVLENE